MAINFAIFFFIFAFIFLYLTVISQADDQLRQHQSINETMTLVSAGKKFRLGFFTPNNSRNQYLGIWYDNIPTQTVVWVANRDNPLNDSSGILKIGDDGNLILQDQTERIVWSTNFKDSSPKSTVAQILDSGNLVLRDENRDGYIWQSFDHPSDTLLAKMKLGRDFKTGWVWNLTSWKSADDPAPGEYTYGMDTRGLPQLVVRKGSIKKYRSGQWNGEQFSALFPRPNLPVIPTIIANAEEMYYGYGLKNEFTVTRSVLSVSGEVQRYLWNNSSLEWIAIIVFPADRCDNYGQCGSNSICTSSDSRICSCLKGYVTRVAQDWEMQNSSGGCIRIDPVNCSKGEGFKEIKGIKMPDSLRLSINPSMTLKDCKMECLKNCSCTAYGNSDVTRGGSGCLLWHGDLIDIKTLTEPSNQIIYIRVTASDQDFKPMVLVMILIPVALVMLLVASCIIWKRKVQRQGLLSDSQPRDEENMELPTFNMITIAEATNNFSDSNKIGEGGFGPVYKGQLATGQEIAVKRLSENSNQGVHEFKNEVILIAKLQHRNLVRLLGCCIQGEERMLIYEYMPNGSLNSFIFGDPNDASNYLPWKRRFDIIVGIARGLLYLHRDSRLRIIHRDLKASNVLLDNKMNPKISDFGIARAFGGDQLLAKTTRVVGTYGYMSPEYVIDGLFSMKSDVFSFGVLVLEIVSGKRNRQFHHRDHEHNLLGHAWKLLIEGKAFELIDPQMEDSFPMTEVLRCIQIGLLCVQQRPEDRPMMSSVVLMFDSEGIMLPQPKQPGFYTDRSLCETEFPLEERSSSINKITISIPEGR